MNTWSFGQCFDVVLSSISLVLIFLAISPPLE
uniref:Uncharacterized protein n=1 Tax=Lepeophtheirus salmonis TaxID=72036 RepID=A0A0K2T383_LEPSM